MAFLNEDSSEIMMIFNDIFWTSDRSKAVLIFSGVKEKGNSLT